MAQKSGSKMNADEQTAEKYLKGLGRGKVAYEPDGNVPPDFSLANSIAVEVRRLSEHYFEGEEPEALEELAIPLWRNLGQAINDLNNQLTGGTYWVIVEYERPSKESGKDTIEAIKSTLKDFHRSGRTPPEVEKVNENLSLVVQPSRDVKGEVFRMAAGMDHDSGGWLVNSYAKNIEHCIEEKSGKIEERMEEYSEWWLVLVDYIGWGLLDREEERLQSQISNLGRFDQVTIIGNQVGESRLRVSDSTP